MTIGVSGLDSTIQTTEAWLDDLAEELGWADRQQAYHVLRAGLHVLRDRLTVDENAHLAAQLPILVRGIYYDGWVPARAPIKRNREEFLEAVSAGMSPSPQANPAEAIRAVFRVLDKHVSKGEIEDVKGQLPKDFRDLWAAD